MLNKTAVAVALILFLALVSGAAANEEPQQFASVASDTRIFHTAESSCTWRVKEYRNGKLAVVKIVVFDPETCYYVQEIEKNKIVYLRHPEEPEDWRRSPILVYICKRIGGRWDFHQEGNPRLHFQTFERKTCYHSTESVTEPLPSGIARSKWRPTGAAGVNTWVLSAHPREIVGR